MTGNKSTDVCPDCGKNMTKVWYDGKSPICICGYVSPPAGVCYGR